VLVLVVLVVVVLLLLLVLLSVFRLLFCYLPGSSSLLNSTCSAWVRQAATQRQTHKLTHTVSDTQTDQPAGRRMQTRPPQ
jgi:hypothetical protein